jgi:hypothetical protein
MRDRLCNLANNKGNHIELEAELTEVPRIAPNEKIEYLNFLKISFR